MSSLSKKAFSGPSSPPLTSVIPGTVYSVGSGEVYGEIGMEDVSELTYPCCLTELDLEPIVDIASSSFHTLALNCHGKLWSWGCNDYGALGRPGEETVPGQIAHVSLTNTRFSKIACGNTISMAITEEGILCTWGTFISKEGIIGYSNDVQKQEYPRIVTAFAGMDIVDIAAGASHCLARSNEGYVYSWGYNEYAQLGRKTTGDDEIKAGLVPTRIGALDDIVAIACGAYHSFAVNRYGQMFVWGSNEFQQCGLVREGSLGEELPKNVIDRPTLMPYFSKADQDYHKGFQATRGKSSKRKTIPLSKAKAEGVTTQMASSSNNKGKTEEATQTDIESSTVTATAQLSNNDGSQSGGAATIKSVSCGDYHTIVLTVDNRLVVFGRCDGGQLGEMFYPGFPYNGAMKLKGTNTLCAIGCPLRNMWHCDHEIKKVVCGANHNLILTQTGEVYGFGHDGHFQLGLYSLQAADVHFPRLIRSIEGIGRVVNASAGDRYSMFIVA